MKKRLVLIIAIILILSFALVGCNLITLNEERDSDQVVASVDRGGVFAEVTKKEFVSYFNSSFPTYANYFGWTVEEGADFFLSMLTREKITLILAVEKLEKQRGQQINKTKFNAILQQNVKKDDSTKGYAVYSAYLMDLLDWDEKVYVKNQTNKMFKDKYDEYIKTELENEKIKNEENKDEDEKNNTKEPRPVKEEKEDNEFKYDKNIGEEDYEAIMSFFDEFKPNENSTQAEKDAYKKQEKILKDYYASYEYYLAKQAESRIVEKYKETYKDELSEEEINTRVTNKYKKLLNEQKKSYNTSDSYKSAIEGDSTVIFHNGKYVRIKSILLQFSESQQNVLKYINDTFSKEEQKDYVKKLREILVFGNIEDIKLPDLIPDSKLGLKVFKSNPDYDPNKPASDPSDEKSGTNYPYIPNPAFDKDEDESETNQKWLSVDFKNILGELCDAIANAAIDADKEYEDLYKDERDEDIAKNPENKEKYEIGKKMFVNQKKAEKFEEWIYLVNDDPGMFEGKDYTETPIGNSSSYVSEFTALVRQLLIDNGTAGSTSIANLGNLFIDDYSFTVEGEEKHTYNGQIYKQTVKVDKFDKNLVKQEDSVVYTYVDKDNANNKLSFVINEFGVHIVMLTNVPIDKEYNDESKYSVEENKDFDMDKFVSYEGNKDLIKEYNSFYTFKPNAFIGFDEETGKAITVADKLLEELQDTFDSTIYSDHTKNLFKMYGEDLFSAKDDEEAAAGYKDFKFNIKRTNSVYKGLISQAKKAFG